MSVGTRTLATLASLLYLSVLAVPCAPPDDLFLGGDDTATVSVFCPCHTGHATTGTGIGVDWQGPPSALAGPPAETLRPPLRFSPHPSPGRAPRPAVPVPIA